ncbi:phosphate-starvation-inducible PsiE family protein [Thermococcus thermotolerans]|uniref:phosphate-starvation-inducible PsiE family protein n=1 Tax=Thermococcus thermotolerans TaxID=2969672 RepID=UPI0021579B85|nr:phosphate-starvation-inducible PsiE family protein [Thermococcus thermotolerans]
MREPTEIGRSVMTWLNVLFDVVVIALATLTMAYIVYIMWRLVINSFNNFDVETVLHQIVLVIIFLEIFELLAMYIKDHHVSMRNVVELGVLAIVRKIVVTLDYSRIEWTTLVGMSLLMFVMGWIYVQERKRITQHEEFLMEHRGR